MEQRPSMKRSHLFITAWLAGWTLAANAAEFKFPNQTLTVPDGFEVELVAAPPLTDRPITADFDELGRLYVTDSSGSNDKVDKQLQEKPHRIVRLEDTDGDGRFDKSIVFADKMMFPEGCLWSKGSLYVSAPPSIWKLTDTDGDGIADRREEWLPAKTLTGCANDLHGPYAGPDGWIYWCKGAWASQTYDRVGQPPFVTRAAHIFRARPDGSGIEAVLTGGMDNPVSVTFTPAGERILTGTFFVHPGGGQRDGLIHAIYGGVYGKDHDVLNGHKRTGDLMPIMTHHGPSASCFVWSYQSSAFGPEYRDNLFACLFNLHKVVRHVLVPEGATFTTRDEDFLVSDNPDFHPTDLVEDSDGSLLVVDTGGWYKICCPTSQLWKPDVLGAIYRVRRSGAPKVADPRGLRIAWAKATPEELTALLTDARRTVQQRAMDQLSRGGAAAVTALQQQLGSSPVQALRRQILWTLTRMEDAGAREAVRLGLKDADETIRQVAAHSVSLWRDRLALEGLLACVTTGQPPLQRVAAEALGRLGDSRAIPTLIKAAGHANDRVLEHSLTYALIEINDPAATRQSLSQSASPHATRVGLIALDQMPNGELKSDSIVPLLASRESIVKETAFWIVGRHPEWAADLATFFDARMRATDLTEAETAQLEKQLSDFAKEAPVQKLLTQAVQENASSGPARLIALHAMARSHLKEMPTSWIDGVGQVLKSDQGVLVAAAVACARALPIAKDSALVASLRQVAANSSQPTETRLGALAALPGTQNSIDDPTFDFLRANLDPAKPVTIRSLAADILAKARLTRDQLSSLTEGIKAVGPLELPKLLGAYEKATDEALGMQLLAAVKASSGLAGLRPDSLRPRLTNFPERVQQEGEGIIASLNVDASKQHARLDELMATCKNGDVRRGQSVFNSQKAACATCHAIGYLGGNVGPDLTRIGQIRTERDLLEAIVYPSASFVRSFEPMVVSTKGGDDYSGVVRKDAPDEIVLATGPGAEVRVPRSDIAEMRPGTVSVMPGGLEEQLSRQELADLIAFLRATRW